MIQEKMLDHIRLKEVFKTAYFRDLSKQTFEAEYSEGVATTAEEQARQLVGSLLDDFVIETELIPKEFDFLAKDKQSFFSLLFPEKLIAQPLLFFKQGTPLIELSSLHSWKKGHGAAILDRLKSFSDKYDWALMLFADVPWQVEYYKKYGFEDKGKLGVNGEYFMIYKKNKVTGWK